MENGGFWDIAFFYIGRVAACAGVFTLGVVCVNWWQLTFGRRRREKQRLNKVRERARSKSGRSVALVVTLSPDTDAYHQVTGYVERELPHINKKMIFKFPEKPLGDYLKPDEIPEIMKSFWKVRSTVMQQDPDVIHLFYAGPVALACMIGADLSNAGEIHVYQNGRGYAHWGRLDNRQIV